MKKVWFLFTLLFCGILFTWCTTTNTIEQPINDTDTQKIESLTFNPDNYVTKSLNLNDEEIVVRAYEGIVYVSNPVDTDREVMNIYVPEAYYNWEEINWFAIDTAPIFFPNKVGWYMPASPESLWESANENNWDFDDFLKDIQSSWEKPQWKKDLWWERPEWMWEWDNHFFQGMQWWMWWEKHESLSLYALKDGYIVASAWARWRTASNWKAPAWIVDLKAAIRYLKYNDDLIPWDSNKIISNWTSAWWAMSALIWATGNNPDYDKYLEEIWAAPASDDVFATSVYCPITNLDNANMAYEWQFYWANGTISVLDADSLDYHVENWNTQEKTLSDEELQHSKELKDAFPEYVNSLWLVDKNWNAYTLDENWEWNFKEDIKEQVIKTFDKALTDWNDLSEFDWLTIEDNHVVDLDFDEYIKNYMARNKNIPAFDWFDLSAWENQLFGTEKIDSRHFTQYAYENSTVSWELAPKELVKIMNPMNYIWDENTDVSHYWRIRHWNKDEHTSLAISFILAKSLEQKENADVDFWYPFNQWHGWDYDIEDFMKWMNSITH